MAYLIITTVVRYTQVFLLLLLGNSPEMMCWNFTGAPIPLIPG